LRRWRGGSSVWSGSGAIRRRRGVAALA
jgi:hypothetical protein